VDLEDLLTGLSVGQIDEEDFIEAALAQALGRQRLDVVRCGLRVHGRWGHGLLLSAPRPAIA
jgi:hypothetical protein